MRDSGRVQLSQHITDQDGMGYDVVVGNAGRQGKQSGYVVVGCL